MIIFCSNILLSNLYFIRSFLSCAWYEEEIWVAGGIVATGVLDIVEIYDPKLDSWRKGPTLARSRWGTMQDVDGTLMVFGSLSVYYSNTMEKLIHGEWVEEPIKYKHGIGHTSVTLHCQ